MIAHRSSPFSVLITYEPRRARHYSAASSTICALLSRKAGKALAAALPNSRTVVLRGAGHMMMAERPDELLAALQG